MITLEQVGAVRTDLIPWHKIPVVTGARVPCGEPMRIPALVDKNGRPRSVATMPGFRKGKKPGNWGKVYEPTHLTIDEIDIMICGRSRTSSSGLRDRALIALLAATGLRISEALDLLPGDITEENDAYRVLVRCGKGGKRRVVGMVPDAWRYLEDWLERRSDIGIDAHSRLFCTIAKPNVGGPLGSPQVRTMLKRVATSAGIDKRVHPHCLRHGVAVNMARLGIPLPVIQRQLGHENVATTSGYLRSLSDDEMFDAMTGITWRADDDAPVRNAPVRDVLLAESLSLADRVRAAVEESEAA